MPNIKKVSRPNGKTVLVTGGARRVGHAIAEELRARGWRVLVSSRTAEGPDVLRADLTATDGAENLFRAAMAAAPNLCAIVNNAAEFTTDTALTHAAVRRLNALNVQAPARLTELLAANCRRDGAVVNILDCRVLRAVTGAETPYAHSKRALLSETLAAARRFPKLRVNGVAPGPVLPPEGAHERAGATPLGFQPTPAHVARAVSFLLDAAATTGCILPVDSGQHLA